MNSSTIISIIAFISTHLISVIWLVAFWAFTLVADARLMSQVTAIERVVEQKRALVAKAAVEIDELLNAK